MNMLNIFVQFSLTFRVGFILLILSSLISNVLSVNILFYFGVSTYSHRIIVWPLVEELVALGHNVSFLSPFPSKEPHPNVTELVPEEWVKLFKWRNPIEDRISGNRHGTWNVMPSLSIQICDLLIQSPKWRKWIDESSYDLILIDSLYNECALGLAYKMKTKRVIYFKTNTLYPWEYDMTGSPTETSWIPNIQNDYSQDMNFLTRLKNVLFPVYYLWYHRWVYYPALEDVLRNGLEISHLPPIHALQANLSLILMNTHYSTDYARSLPPMFISIGGMTSKNMKLNPLPQEMIDFINTAHNGFFYVSFGSSASVSNLPQELQRAFFYAFGNSTLKFIWKYEGKTIPVEMPSNVFTQEWMPQEAILNHPRCKGFITHGGRGSIHEAKFSGVPLIVLPIFADQDYNAERVERLGFGLKLELVTLTQNDLEISIHKLIEDNSYKNKMKEMSISFSDRQNSPLETAVWWIEKVIRSSDFDLSLLRPIGINQSWFVRRSLDVWLFLFIIAATPPILLLYIMSKCLLNLLSTNVTKLKIHQKKLKSK